MKTKYEIYGKMHFMENTPFEVKAILNQYLHTDKRLRIFLGDEKEYWLEEYDVIGYIGRSSGEIKIPLLIRNSKSNGGGSISTNCIKQITLNKKIIYKDPSFKIKEFKIKKSPYADKGYTHGVFYNGKNVSNFKSLEKAERYIAFMKGERNKM